MTSQRDIRVWRRVVAFALPLTLFAAIGVCGMVLWEQGRLNRFICDGECGPAFVVAPDGVAAPPIASPSGPQVAVPEAVDVAAAQRVLARALRDEPSVERVGLAVGAQDGSIVTSGTPALVPASTTKILTAFAALESIEPGTRFATRTVLDGQTLTIVGGGDPFLTAIRDKSNAVQRADLATLARRTAAGLDRAGQRQVRLRFDDSLFSGPAFNPTWRASYTSDNVVNPTSALALFRGMPAAAVVDDPAAQVARAFARELKREGVDVVGSPRRAVAPARAVRVAAVRSATVEQIVEYVVSYSDNEGAEALLRHISIASGGPGSISDGTAQVRARLERAGIATPGLALHDGSGLSRSNRISPRTLVETLMQAHATTQSSGLLADLPVAGFSGSMAQRVARSGARGEVRAKTGTLQSVHALAGYVTTTRDQPIFFAALTDSSRPQDALNVRAALDRATAALAQCDCRVQ